MTESLAILYAYSFHIISLNIEKDQSSVPVVSTLSTGSSATELDFHVGYNT
jgi:hypothetical protein